MNEKKTKMFDYILNNKSINSYLLKQPQDYRQDFYTTILEWLNADNEKTELIFKLFKNEQLGMYCMGMIRNGGKPNSPWFKKYNNINIVYSELALSNWYVEETEKVTIDEINIIGKIIQILNSMDLYHSILFKLKIGISPITEELVEPLSYNQIQDKIGISYTSVRNSCKKTEKIIKQKLKNDINNYN